MRTSRRQILAGAASLALATAGILRMLERRRLETWGRHAGAVPRVMADP